MAMGKGKTQDRQRRCTQAREDGKEQRNRVCTFTVTRASTIPATSPLSPKTAIASDGNSERH